MKAILIAILSFAAGAVLIAVFLNHRGNAVPEPTAKEEGAARPDAHETNQEGVVKLALDKQTLIGLQLAAPEPAAMAPVISGFARVIDPSGLIASISEIELAQATLAASQKEFDRLKVLHQQNQNVSTRVLETAEATLKHDQLTADATRLKVLNAWGRAVLDRSDLATFMRSLAGQTNALVRVDLPLTDSIDFTPKDALLTSVTDEKTSATASYISRLSSVDPQSQGQGFLFLVTEKPNEWSIGTALTAHLEKGDKGSQGYVVPRAAVVRSQGIPWIYVQKGADTFARIGLDTGRPSPKGWFVTNGLSATNRIIVQGAQTVLSHEMSGAGSAPGLQD
jgi:hypothetical protein